MISKLERLGDRKRARRTFDALNSSNERRVDLGRESRTRREEGQTSYVEKLAELLWFLIVLWVTLVVVLIVK